MRGLRHRPLVLALAALAAAGAAAAAVAQDENPGAGAPSLPSGRALRPQGRTVAVGSFPIGGAVTPDGRFAWAVTILRRT